MSPNVDELVDGLLADFPPATTPAQEFLGEQFDRGLAWVHFPTDCGGLGLTPQGPAAGAVAAACRRRAGRRHEEPHRLRHVRAHHRHPRHRRAEGALPAPPLHLRGDLVPALQRARCRLRRGRALDPGRARRRRVGAQRAEGVDDAGPHLGLRAPRGPDQPRRAQAPGDDGLPRRHAGARRRGAAALPDHRRGGVQRGVLHRRPHARRGPDRRRGRRAGAWRSPRS